MYSNEFLDLKSMATDNKVIEIGVFRDILWTETRFVAVIFIFSVSSGKDCNGVVIFAHFEISIPKTP